ncbi:MAG TPA: c-type cytochrome [Candidatus Binataceae bacterium]|nr:c-type cytochrome [Candidatus Binataceae bacterium]
MHRGTKLLTRWTDRLCTLRAYAWRSEKTLTVKPLILAALGGICLIVCGPRSARAFPWSTDMFQGAAVQPLAIAPRVMPSGTLPTDGIQKMDLEQMTVGLKNPLKETPANLAHGKELFLNTCEPCHGENADGNGPVAHLLQHKPTNLTTGISKNLPDGYIYGYIRNGGIWMPSYDDAMSSNERWDVIMYVRSMQAKAAEAAKNKASSP